METTNFVNGHSQRVNIALLRGVTVREAELWWVEQLWSHVTDNAWLGRCRTTWFHDSGICYDTSDPKVPQACGTVVSDQNVSLDRTNIGVRLELRMHSALTGLTSLWTMLSECRYSRPQAACASYRNKFQTGFL